MEGDPGGGDDAADQPADVQQLFAILTQSASGSFAAGALAALDVAVQDALAVRYAAMSADEVRAVVRGLYRAAARVEAAALRAVKALDDADLPGGRPSRRSGTQAAAFLRHAVGLDGPQSRRDAAAARLLDADTGDLKATGAAFAAGRIRRGHADVAARVHAALGAAVRERVDAAGRRCVDAVDEVLAEHALTATVTELDRFGKRLVEELNPPGPDGAHARRFLHISGLRDGSLLGRFACGPAQAALLRAAIAAGASQRPGKGIDADGVTHELPDERSLGQRQMDALVELVAAGLGRSGLQPPDVDGSGEDDPAARQPSAEKPATEEPAGHERSEERPPPREGREQVLRPPGALVGAYPDVGILVITTLDQLTQALGANHPPPEPPDSPAGPNRPPGLAHMANGDAVHSGTLRLLACAGRLRRVLVGRDGAVLDLGRAARYASRAQRRALMVRDGGCLVPGCPVPGDVCDAHHPNAWADGGATDLSNLSLLCARHHAEVHEGLWDVEVRDGIPWIRPPAWIRPDRPLLRNLAHRRTA